MGPIPGAPGVGTLRYLWSRPSGITPVGGHLSWLGGSHFLPEVQVMFRLQTLDETASSKGVFEEEAGVTQ